MKIVKRLWSRRQWRLPLCYTPRTPPWCVPFRRLGLVGCGISSRPRAVVWPGGHLQREDVHHGKHAYQRRRREHRFCAGRPSAHLRGVVRTGQPLRDGAGRVAAGAGETGRYFGIGASGILAEYTSRLFSRIGLPAIPLNRTGIGLAEQLIALQRGDVLVMMAQKSAHREGRPRCAKRSARYSHHFADQRHGLAL